MCLHFCVVALLHPIMRYIRPSSPQRKQERARVRCLKLPLCGRNLNVEPLALRYVGIHLAAPPRVLRVFNGSGAEIIASLCCLRCHRSSCCGTRAFIARRWSARLSTLPGTCRLYLSNCSRQGTAECIHFHPHHDLASNCFW